MNTTIAKDSRGTWRATTCHRLPNKYQLDLLTYKDPSGLVVSTATVNRRDGAFVEHRVFEDFYKRVFVRPCSRVTSKVIEAQHHELLAGLPALLKEVQEKYKFVEDITV